MDVQKLGPQKTVKIETRKKGTLGVFKAQDESIYMHYWTNRILFAISEIPPGGKSSLDPGHESADELAYVIEGEIAVEFPNEKRIEKLAQGDSILIPEGVPHIVQNIGKVVAVSAWATAPHLGYTLDKLTGQL